MVVYSFSQINLYNQCPRKYQYRYLDKLERSFESSPDLILGTSVHSALEWLYQQINVFKKPIKADLLGKFHEYRQNSIAEAGEQLVYKGEQQEEDYLRRGEHYLSEYYNKHHPFEEGKVVATELLLNFKLAENTPGNEQSFRGIIDRLDKVGDDCFIINDYKTNKNLPPEEKDEYREQLTLYAYGIQQKYGKYLKSIKARLHYLHFDIIDERDITEETLAPILKKYSDQIQQIEMARFDYNMGVNNAFPTKQNPYCKYCEYQNLCPLRQHLNYGEELVDGGELGEQTIQHLVDRYAKISRESSDLSKEKDSLKEILIAYAEKKGFEQLFGDESQIGLSKGEMYSAKDKSELQNFLKEHGLLDEAIDIPYYKINSLVKEKKLTPDQISLLLNKKDSRRITPSKKKTNKNKEE